MRTKVFFPTAHKHLIISKLKLVQSTECTVSRLPSIIVTKDMHNLDICHFFFIGWRLWRWDRKWLWRERRNGNRIRARICENLCLLCEHHGLTWMELSLILLGHGSDITKWPKWTTFTRLFWPFFRAWQDKICNLLTGGWKKPGISFRKCIIKTIQRKTEK